VIRFFRHFRKYLIQTGGFRKYLLYGLGEIVLVVIGILIALQVSNWNEARKKRKELSILFKDTQEFLKPIGSWSGLFLHKYQNLDSVLTLLNANSEASYYQQNSELVHFLFNDTLTFKLPVFYWVSPGMRDLIDRKTEFPASHKPLIYDLVTWQDASIEVETLTGDFEQYIQSLRVRLIDKAPFLLEKDSVSLSKSIDFICETGWYRYELKRVKQFTDDLVKVMDLHRGNYGELYGQLELIENQSDSRQLDSLFRNAGFLPAKHLTDFIPAIEKPEAGFVADRGVSLPENTPEIRSWWHLLFNKTNEKITFQVLYEEWIVGEWSTSGYTILRRRIPEGSVLKVIYPDSTAQYYETGKGRYLIIDP